MNTAKGTDDGNDGVALRQEFGFLGLHDAGCTVRELYETESVQFDRKALDVLLLLLSQSCSWRRDHGGVGEDPEGGRKGPRRIVVVWKIGGDGTEAKLWWYSAVSFCGMWV